MALKTYILLEDYHAPYVQITGRADRPQNVKVKKFRRGDQVKGELKHVNNKPDFVVVGGGGLIIPVSFLKEIVTKEISSNASGGTTTSLPSSDTKPKTVTIATNPKVRYIDAVLVGALVGVIGVIVAEKQELIKNPDKKNKIYGALAGGALAAYIVFRAKNAKPKKQVITQVKED